MAVMDEVDVVNQKIQELCQQIAHEQDLDVVRERSAALQRFLKVQHDTTSLRLQNITMHYDSQMRSAPRHSTPAVEAASQIRSVLVFLGLVPV